MNHSLMTRRPNSIWDFMSEVERIFDDAWKPEAGTAPAQSDLPIFHPTVDVRETGDNYLISVDLPGIPKNQIKIDFQDGRLTISGERSNESRAEKDKFHRVERSYGRFERTFQLPNDVNSEQIQARFEDGVLEVLVPKAEPSKGRSIEIEGDCLSFALRIRVERVDVVDSCFQRADPVVCLLDALIRGVCLAIGGLRSSISRVRGGLRSRCFLIGCSGSSQSLLSAPVDSIDALRILFGSIARFLNCRLERLRLQTDILPARAS